MKNQDCCFFSRNDDKKFFDKEDEVVKNRDKYKIFIPMKYSYNTHFVFPYKSLPTNVEEDKVFMLVPIPEDTMAVGEQ